MKKFSDFAKVMIDDLGDVIRPYLKAFYNGLRDLPEITDNGLSAELAPYDEVRTFDVANFDKEHIDPLYSAEIVSSEQEKQKQAEASMKEISEKRNLARKKTVSSQQTKGDLFGDEKLIENKKENGRKVQELSETIGTQRESDSRDGIERENRRVSDGIQERESVRLERTDKRGLDENIQGRRNDGRGDKGIQRKDVEILEVTGRPSGRLQGLDTSEENPISPSERKETNNNHSERGQNHAPISVDARIEANIKAIELAQQLIESGEKATMDQMFVLRKFSGWGGLGKAFNEQSPWYTLPDGRYSNENETRKRLQELLGAEAYQQAVMSANSAYYTPSYVVDTLWDIAEQMGFEGGNILEGSAGIGNVLGQMPTNIRELSNIQAVEIDGTAGGILSLLYPDAKVDIQGFEQTRIPNGSVDLAITNVPFVTGLRVNDTVGDSDLSKKFHNIHDFCIAKNVRKLREGGIGIFITSNGTLDNSKKLRDWITNEGCSDFVGAFRMNNKTFGGTGVTSDIIVVRKRVNGRKSANAIDVSDISGERSAEYHTGETRKIKGKEVFVVKNLSMDYNKYFIEHPENMAGEMNFAFEKGDRFRPTIKGLYPTKEKNQEQMLADFVKSFKEEEFSDKGSNTDADVAEVMPDKKIGEMFERDGKLYVNSTASSQLLSVNDNKVKGHTKVECFNAYSAIKQALNDVLSYQTENDSDNGLKPLLSKLNKVYDAFIDTYGHFNKNTSISFLRNDVDYANIASVETYDEKGDGKGGTKQTFDKADVMKSRVVEKEKEPTPTNVKDGLVASVFKFGRIDVSYIASQIGESQQDVKSKIISDKLGFEDPATRQMELSYQYLCGNVREKLRQAEVNNKNGEYDNNIKALQDVIPMDIPAHLIDFTLGSSWIDPKLYNDYTKERTDIDVKFTSVGGTWFMDSPDWGLDKEKNRSMGVFSEKFHKQIMGHTLIEAAIQNKSITVSETHKKWDGSTETITDKEATQACATKIDEIRQDFKEFARQRMQSDSDMSAQMERIYNETFNNYVPPTVGDEFIPIHFPYASRKITLEPHQSRAVMKGLYEPLLLAHEVGAGKTFTLISTAMEMRRLGTARKPMIVVQNATVGQFVASAKELYPNAKLLTLEDSDRTEDGRKHFYAKIRYNDWDMIVIPQSTFEFIPDSEERQMAFVQDKIEEKMIVLEQMKEADPNGKSLITRQAEREIVDLESQLAEISKDASKKRTASNEKKRAVTMQNAEVKALEMLDRRTDDVENFDDMGIDALLIDEAHEYKHLGFATAMQRGVKGIDSSYSKKSQGVYLKTQAVLEKNNGRNVIFATGTPISNTAAEIWTFMRYLMPADTMKEYGIYYFDDFVRNFGNIQQMLEFSTSGKPKEQNRFSGYVNLPELIRIWSSMADTVTTKEIEDQRKKSGKPSKIPDIEGGKAKDLYLPQTKALRSIMKYVKAQLEDYEKMSGKEKKENSHIPLIMYGIAKAAAIDSRLVDSNSEDDKNSKTNEAVRQTLRSLKDTQSYKGTVAIFADNYQNSHSGFNLYDDIRTKLIAEGIPANEVVVIKSGMSVKKKLEIFDKVNKGEIRVVMGSTFTLGTGVNIQERLHTVIHIDVPNRPMDYTQRNGRILRQGNLHKSMDKPVRVLRFGVEDSLDVTAYQRLKTKGAIADSIMNGKQMMQNSMVNRALEEEEDVFGDTVAQLSGSEYAMLKNNAEKNVRKYEIRKKQWEADQTYIYNTKNKLKGQIAEAEQRAKGQREYLQDVQKAFADGKSKEITVGTQSFATVDDMTDFVKDYNKKILDSVKKMKDSGTNGEQKRELTVSVGGYDFNVKTVMSNEMARGGGQLFSETHRVMTYSCAKLGLVDVPVRQALLRNALEDITENVITGKDFSERAEAAERSAKYNQSELDHVLSRDGKPFEYDKELEQSRAQYIEYAELMKKEMEEKEDKYAEIDKTVEASKELDSVEEDDVLMREDELSEINEKVTEKSLVGPRELRKQMAERVNELADKLSLDNVEIIIDASKLDGKKRKAKGFYTKSTGKITIIIGNHTSFSDVEKTLLHEAVAHYGLRKMFGAHFETFLDNVFNNADESIRRQIVTMATKNGLDFRKATEEYLAHLSEQGFSNFEELNFWDRIKSLFVDCLHRIGVSIGVLELNDSDLRYILWKSYKNLERGSKSSSLFEKAEDALMLDKIGREEGDLLFRSSTSEPTLNDTALRIYEDSMVRYNRQTIQSWQDKDISIKRFQESLEKESRRKIEDYENTYLISNHTSSKNRAQLNLYDANFVRPLIKSIEGVLRSNRSIDYSAVVHYVMEKHGLERNSLMSWKSTLSYARKKCNSKKDSAELLKKIDEIEDKELEVRNELNKKLLSGSIDQEKYNNELSSIRNNLSSYYSQFEGTDYSGLEQLMNSKDYTEKARSSVKIFENINSTDALWSSINNATKESLRISYEGGMISKETYEKVLSMYNYYIPLRGWEEDVASDVYHYYTSSVSPFNAPLANAKGRSSIADDPFATICNMGESSILQANKNKMKQSFVNMVSNHPSSLATVKEMWYTKTFDEDGKEVWEPSLPNIRLGTSADEIQYIVSHHEETMKSLEEYGQATKYRKGLKLKYKSSSSEKSEHEIRVKISGKEYVVYINGNPTVAQAVNDLLRYDGGEQSKVSKLWLFLLRLKSRLVTALNPAFVVTNFARDFGFSGFSSFVKNGARYWFLYRKNYVLNCTRIFRLNHLYNKGKLDINNRVHVAFKEFIEEGGRTGYAYMQSVEDHKKKISKMLNRLDGSAKSWSINSVVGFFKVLGELGGCVEDVSRFSAYQTSREFGRSILESIRDAKEITVNFDRKGSGENILARYFLHNKMFFNATLQGCFNFFGNAKKNPIRFSVASCIPMLCGFMMPFLNGLLYSILGGDDDDPEKNPYFELSDWERRNNLCIYAGNKWIKIPLAIELRALYGLGDIFYCVYSGRNKYDNVIKDVAVQLSSLFPLDIVDDKTLFPDNVGDMLRIITPDQIIESMDIVLNKDFKGSTIYDNSVYTKLDPEYQRGKDNTNKLLVGVSKYISEASGGNEHKRGSFDCQLINPAVMEHLLGAFTGGLGGTINQSYKTIDDAISSNPLEWRNVPILSRLIRDRYDANSVADIRKAFNYYKQEAEATNHELNMFKHDKSDTIRAAKMVKELMDPSEPRYIRLFFYKGVKKQLSHQDKLLETYEGNEEMTSTINKMILSIKERYILDMEQLDDSISNSKK
ncbi:MAG: LPD38 domain-containing protein [Bacteroidaceae bacterium]